MYIFHRRLTLSAPTLFSAKYKFFFFFRKFIASSVFMLERYIKRHFFLEKGLKFFFFFFFFFSYKHEKNEKSSQK